VLSKRPAQAATLIFVVALATLPFWTTGTYYNYLALLVLIYSISAIGLNILTGYAGQLSLAQAAFMAVGAYGTALLSKAVEGVSNGSGINVLIGMVVGTVAAALCGTALAVPAIRVRGPYLAMVTIAFGWIVWKILVEWVSVTGGDLGVSAIPKAQFGSLLLDMRGFYYLVLALFLAVLVIQRRLIRSQFGLQIRAIKYNETAVASVGIDVQRVKLATFIISATVSGFAGTLFAHQQSYINPDSFQIFDSVFILLAVLFGGAGTMLGPVVGTVILILLPEALHTFEEYRLMVYGGFILLTLYLMPNGIVGEVLRRGFKKAPFNRESAIANTFDTGGAVAASGATLEIEGISHSFGGLAALSNVSFTVEREAIHALIGPNGAGKTTMINIVTGMHATQRGRIVIDGVETKIGSLHLAARQGIVRTFQNLTTFGDLTAVEHVVVGLSGQARMGFWKSLLGSKRTRERWKNQWEEARDLLSLVGLSHLEQVPANALSYGHRRLVEIARAIGARPRVLLLDEPAAGLVADEVRDLARLIKRLKLTGMTILLVEHNIDLVLSVSDRITVLDQGFVIADGPPEIIRQDEKVIAAYLGPSYSHA